MFPMLWFDSVVTITKACQDIKHLSRNIGDNRCRKPKRYFYSIIFKTVFSDNFSPFHTPPLASIWQRADATYNADSSRMVSKTVLLKIKLKKTVCARAQRACTWFSKRVLNPDKSTRAVWYAFQSSENTTVRGSSLSWEEHGNRIYCFWCKFL